MTKKGREIILRLSTGDLVEEFQKLLDEISDADPSLSGGDEFDD